MISLRYLAETHTKPLWEYVHNLGCLGFPQKTLSNEDELTTKRFKRRSGIYPVKTTDSRHQAK